MRLPFRRRHAPLPQPVGPPMHRYEVAVQGQTWQLVAPDARAAQLRAAADLGIPPVMGDQAAEYVTVTHLRSCSCITANTIGQEHAHG